MTVGEPLRLLVLCPHFRPDTAPTGVVMTRIVDELVARGHEVHVVTSLPWYRAHAIEPGWGGRLVRVERTPWGSVTRVHPFPGADKSNLVRRALGFLGFSVLVGGAGLVAGVRRPGRRRGEGGGDTRGSRRGSWRGSRRGSDRGGVRVDAVVAMSPPLTLGVTAWLVHLVRRGPVVFNVQDVFPDAAVATGAITDRRVIAAARWLERATYARSSAVTVLSDDLRRNVEAKIRPGRRDIVHVIPNFVDTDAIAPRPRLTEYRRRLALGDGPVVMYAGNVGFSQSLDLVVAAARALPDVTFVVNGDGSARASLEAGAGDLANLRFHDYVPVDELADMLASADVHVVPLKSGLGSVSVPSKTYSILAAGRPVLAAIDPGTEVPRILEASGAGVSIPPDDPEAFTRALRSLLGDPDVLAARGRAGREYVERAVSPAAVAERYETLIRSLARGDRGSRATTM